MFVLILGSMWYFVERQGRALKKAKSLEAALAKKYALCSPKLPPKELRVTDALGNIYD